MATKSPSVTNKPGKKSQSVTKENPTTPSAPPIQINGDPPRVVADPSASSPPDTFSSACDERESSPAPLHNHPDQPTQHLQSADPFRELFGVPLSEACGENKAPHEYNASNESDQARVVLMARDPNSAYAYWHLPAAGTPGAANSLVLRLYQDMPGHGEGGSQAIHEVNANTPNASSYFENLAGNGQYHAELGTRTSDGHFTTLLKSNSTTTPRDARTLSRTHETAQKVEQTSQFGVSEAEVRAYYRELMASLNPHRRRRIASRLAVASRTLNKQPDAVSSWILGGSEQNHRPTPSLFIDVQAELVVFGRIQVGAQLKLEGKPVVVREDGTFSLRLAIPPSEMRLPFVAHGENGESRGVALTLAYSKMETTK